MKEIRKNTQTTTQNEDIPHNTKETVRRLFHRMAQQKKKLLAVAAATLLSSAAFTAMPLAMGLGIDRLVAAIRIFDSSVGIFRTAMQALGLPLLIMSVIFLISSLLTYIQQYITASIGEEFVLSLRKDVSAKLNRLPLRYFDTHKAGDIMSRITNDLEKVSYVMQVGLMQFISSVFTIVLTVIVMLALSPKLFMVVVISLTLSMVATVYVSGLAQKAYGENMASMGALTGKIEEIYTGNRIVKLFNQQEPLLKEAEALNEWQYKAQRKAQFADYAIYPAIRFLSLIHI